jgi:zinc D-Ala-D-Ala dipeptidase
MANVQWPMVNDVNRKSAMTMNPRNRISLSLWLALLLGMPTAIFAQIPVDPNALHVAELVELNKIDPAIKLDIRYATANNFAKQPVYKEARAFLQRAAAEALLRAHQKLRAQGFGLLIFDGYRPWSVTKLFWEITPADKKQFVADPSKGSRHNRGCAVDLTLYDLQTGKAVPMPSEYDDFSERAHPNYQGGTEQERKHRELLRAAMEQEGFTVYENEWWHFDYKDWRDYPILNLSFSEIKPPTPAKIRNRLPPVRPDRQP